MSALTLVDKIRQWPLVFSLLVLKAGGLKALKTYIKEKNRNRFHIVSRNPPVVLLWWGRNEQLLHQYFKGEGLTLLYLFAWDIGKAIPNISATIHNTLAKFPAHRIVCLCNEQGQAESFHKHGVEAIFFNHNALVDENVFNISKNSKLFPKKWDAIYNATMSPYKRIELASAVDSLCIVSSKYHASSDSSYQLYIESILPNAFWANKSSDGFHHLSSHQINHLILQSKVGLCLSETEGAMLASIEYLLSGVPVVTTPSNGGRDVFFNDFNSILCHPDPESVRKSVQELRNRVINSQLIRDSAISIIHNHRARLASLLANIDVDITFPWTPLFKYQHISTLYRDMKRASSDET